MDPYVTTNRLTHIDFPKDQRNGIGERDIVTFYVGKGYKPKNAPAIDPLISNRSKPVYDAIVFPKPIYDRIARQPMKRVPNL